MVVDAFTDCLPGDVQMVLRPMSLSGQLLLEFQMYYFLTTWPILNSKRIKTNSKGPIWWNLLAWASLPTPNLIMWQSPPGLAPQPHLLSNFFLPLHFTLGQFKRHYLKFSLKTPWCPWFRAAVTISLTPVLCYVLYTPTALALYSHHFSFLTDNIP